MHQSNILITGAFSGIGKEFVRAYLKDSSNCIIALDKDFPSQNSPSGSGQDDHQATFEVYRRDVGDAEGQRLELWSMDITDENQLARLSHLKELRIVIHSAGIRGLVPSRLIKQGSDVAGAETMDAMTPETMLHTFNVNTIGTFLLLRTLMPSLRANNGNVIVMGSRMGSVGHNYAGGGYAYRASKAALNAVVKSLSIDVPEVRFAIVHPGRVESNLVGEGIKEEGAVTAEESVSDMLKLIPRLSKDDTGKFMDRFGKEIVW